jgi:hypothetical protein
MITNDIISMRARLRVTQNSHKPLVLSSNLSVAIDRWPGKDRAAFTIERQHETRN